MNHLKATEKPPGLSNIQKINKKLSTCTLCNYYATSETLQVKTDIGNQKRVENIVPTTNSRSKNYPHDKKLAPVKNYVFIDTARKRCVAFDGLKDF